MNTNTRTLYFVVRNLSGFASLVVVASVGLYGGPTCAQDDDKTIEEIVVTGSRIARRDYVAASPVVTLDQREFSLTGTTEVRNLLDDLPQADPVAGTSNGSFGAAGVNLRGMGDFRTLVLLNGRRLVPWGIFGSPDLNPLPPVMIERVEIISGGASAVYGSDALAGAINFILRDDFDGFETSLQYDVTDRGDGDTYKLDIAFGTPFADGRGNLALFGDYYDRSTVFQDERSFSRNPLSSDDDTGAIIPDTSLVSGAGAIYGDLGVDFYTFDPDGSPRLFVDPDDRFNSASTNALRAPMERFSVNALGHYDMDNDVRVYFEASFSHSAPQQRRSDVYADFVEVNIDRPDISPALASLLSSNYDPDGNGIAEIFLLKRFTSDTGEAIKFNDRDFARAMIGFEGGFDSGWKWSTDFSHSSTDRDMRVSNDSSVSRIQQGMLVDPITGDCFDVSNGCVPVNPFGEGNLTQAAVEFFALTDTTADEQVREQVFNATFHPPAIELWAGDLNTAMGVEYRRNESSFTPSESILSGDSLFFGSDVASTGVISVKEAFAEARLPLLTDVVGSKYLGVEAGVRVSDYNTLDDDVWTWKFGGEWQVTEGFRLRAMQQRAIRAPNVAELYQDSIFFGYFFGLGPHYDQCSASRDPVDNGLAELCIAQGIAADQIGVFEADFYPTEISFSSNPDLQPEEADTLTAGLVWQPEWIDGLAASADYFQIEIDPAIGAVYSADLTTLCFIVRDPNDPFCRSISRGPSGDISEVRTSFQNAAVARAEGIDFALEYNWDADSWALFDGGANFDLSLIATYFLEAGTQGSPLAPFLDCAGKFGTLCNDWIFSGALPDLRMNTRLTYHSGPLTASLRWERIGNVVNSETEIREVSGRPPPLLAVPRVPATDYLDLTFEAAFGEYYDLSFGAVNLTDKQPPFLGSANQEANTDPHTYDILGRRYFLRITVRY